MRPSRLAQSAAWDRTALTVGDLGGAASTAYYRRAEMALVARAFGPLHGQRVLKLDLWNEAFNTRILHWMEEQGAEAHALDLSRVVAHRARRNALAAGRRARFVRADIREVPFADRSFDALYTMGTIEHIEEYRQALAEVARVLRPGGRAVIGVPARWNPFLRPAMVWLLARVGCYAYAPERAFSGRELRREVAAVGLRVREQTAILALPGVLRMADLFLHTRRWPLERLTRALLHPFEWLERRPACAARLGYLLAVIAERPA